MNRSKLLVVLLSGIMLAVTSALFVTGRLTRDNIQHYVPWTLASLLYPAEHVFTEYDSPLKESHWIYDSGVVDANGDGLLDIFTTNHNWRQLLLIADGQGGYQDMLSAWGLDHSREFPGIEISTIAPEINKPGIYIYWYNRHLYIRNHQIEHQDPVNITVHALTELDIIDNSGFHIDSQDSEVLFEPFITESKIRFSSTKDAVMELYPISRGVPINVELDDSIPLAQVYVGNQLVVPGSRELSLLLQDRHAMVWSDFNDDGQSDIFITRGAIGGTLRVYPEHIASQVDEEFFVSRSTGVSANKQFEDILSMSGITKNGCSARHANWVDSNTDGLLDLFINCEDVGNVNGDYPNKLYQQNPDKQFTEVAEQAGLQILDNNIIDYEWFDADDDADMDLFAHQDNGFYLYRNNNGRFLSEFIYRGEFARIDNPGLKGASGAYWVFDGKLSVADYDRDGDLDVFSASKKGNALLINNAGSFTYLAPSELGLPAKSVSASWVDYDNDGSTDLHTVPAGIFRQTDKQVFEKTNLLILPSDLYMASIINWYDINNDGARDVMIALNENQSLHRWWEPSIKDTFLWTFPTYINQGNKNHWLQFNLVGDQGNREAIGARVTVTTPDAEQIQEVGINDGAFYSQGHYRLYFGLGHNSKADLVTIRWPDGETQKLENISTNTLHVIERNKQVTVE